MQLWYEMKIGDLKHNTRDAKSSKNIWLPDFQHKYLENEERYEFAVCGKWKNEESYIITIFGQNTPFWANYEPKNHFKDRALFCNFQAFCGKFDLRNVIQTLYNYVAA